MLTFIARLRGYKPRWVFHSYVARFHDRPPAYSIDPIPPTPEVWSWVRSQQIRFAKARERAKAS
jgi:DNA repair protein RadD